MVRQWQEFFYEKDYVATRFFNPDFVKLAEAYDMVGLRVTEKAAVRPMIERMKVYAESVNEDSMAGLEAEQERHLIEILLAVKTNLNRLLVNGEDAPVNIPDGED